MKDIADDVRNAVADLAVKHLVNRPTPGPLTDAALLLLIQECVLAGVQLELNRWEAAA